MTKIEFDPAQNKLLCPTLNMMVHEVEAQDERKVKKHDEPKIWDFVYLISNMIWLFFFKFLPPLHIFALFKLWSLSLRLVAVTSPISHSFFERFSGGLVWTRRSSSDESITETERHNVGGAYRDCFYLTFFRFGIGRENRLRWDVNRGRVFNFFFNARVANKLRR